ncbi:MAG: cytochrome c nitrite reductase pentaheme subunit [Syntrophorhabdus sp. PtaU1.Bin153]|nr:MAG: cytochrome c nitrite reductase pentaheme subunit [Syntrophorhabdus sp. PtaU1.Bin153]
MRRLLPERVVSVVVFVILCFMSAAYGQGRSDYIGSDMCKQCHEDMYDNYVKSMHGKKYVSGSPARREGCESCHGPGSIHAQKAGEKGTILSFGKPNNAKGKSAQCMACHGDSKHLTFWNMSRHNTVGVSCDLCHTIHKGPKTPLTSTITPAAYQRYLLKMPVPELCYGCHQDVRSQTMRQSHHPVREGMMACYDCHSVHGSFGPKMMKSDTANELCYSCHAEKRGPFMFEHPPVAENCMNCHVAHGSNHTPLLVRKTPQLCQNCHDASQHPGRPYTSFETFKGASPSNRMFSRNCRLCHSTVHGSTSPTSRGEHFLR